jgi:hypothetical protein
MVLKVRRFTFLTVAVAAAAFGFLSMARGAPGDLTFRVEPGIGHLTYATAGRTASPWGLLGAVSTAVGVSDRINLQIYADQKLFLSQHPTLEANVWGVTMVYNLDSLDVTPYAELGAGVFRWSQGRASYGPQAIPVLGAGCDWRLSPMWWAGFGVRYHAVFDSALLDNPGYSTLNARVGLVVDPF